MIVELIVVGTVLAVILLFGIPGLALIRDNRVGIVTKNMFGTKLPEGHIIATNGEVGVQSEILMPGLYWRIPYVWKIESVPVTEISPNSIGVVESIDGKQLPAGRLLADEVECDSFQNATKFLDNGGYKGLQIGILRPGTYRINTKVFKISNAPATVIPREKIGLAVSLDGKSLQSSRVIAPAPDGNHDHFQNGQEFINKGGYRGPQLETLQPGEYYINPYLFSINTVDIATVPPGYVAVIVSSVGDELESLSMPTEAPMGGDSAVVSHEVPLITDKNMRGILRDPVAPGKYNLNTIAYKSEMVPTSAVTIKWGTQEPEGDTFVNGMDKSIASQKATEFYQYSQLRATSKDGFQLDVDVKLIIRIPPDNAPYVISRFGTVNNLIEQVVHPLIDSTFRNEAGNKEAMSFIHSRTDFQETSLKKAQQEFAKYHVEVQGLLIAYIKVDQALLDTQTKKQIALQQRSQYEEEARAQDSRIAVTEKTARADKQKDVIAAKLSIDIAQDEATAAVNKAIGTRDATKTIADGEAYQAKIVGEAQAAAYEAQTNVLGKDKVAIIKVIEQIGKDKVIITPTVNVSSGGNGDSNMLINALIATMMAEDGNLGKIMKGKQSVSTETK
jgi:regulator of protease activity HflC (stomatin/prohibitin superfamily)